MLVCEMEKSSVVGHGCWGSFVRPSERLSVSVADPGLGCGKGRLCSDKFAGLCSWVVGFWPRLVDNQAPALSSLGDKAKGMFGWFWICFLRFGWKYIWLD